MYASVRRRDSEQELEEGEIGDDSFVQRSECEITTQGVPSNTSSKTKLTSSCVSSHSEAKQECKPCKSNTDKPKDKAGTSSKEPNVNRIKNCACNKDNRSKNANRPFFFKRTGNQYGRRRSRTRNKRRTRKAKSKPCTITPQLNQDRAHNSSTGAFSSLSRKPSFCSDWYDARSSNPKSCLYSHHGGVTALSSGSPRTPSGSGGKYTNTWRTRLPISRSSVENYLVDNDASYDDLLEQYKSIKAQLDSLNKPTSFGSSAVSDKDRSSTWTHRNVGVDKENRQGRIRNNRGRRRKASLVAVARSAGKSSTATSRDNHDRSTTPESKTSNLNGQASRNHGPEIEEEEDEAELRRIALASAFRRSQREPVTSNENSLKITQHGMFNLLGDNYETVAMDLGSDDEASQRELSSEYQTQPMTTEDDEDLNEEALREMLLKSLALRKKEKPCPVEDIQEISEASSPTVPQEHKVLVAVQENQIPELPGDQSGDDTKLKSKKLPMLPRMEPVIINLAEDSSSDESADENEPGHDDTSVKEKDLPFSLPEAFEMGVDRFLRAARLKCEAEPGPVLPNAENQQTTPLAVYQLSKAQQLEYRKLKAEIARREMGRKVEQDSSHPEPSETLETAVKKQKLVKCEHNLQLHRFHLKTEQQKLVTLKSKVVGKKTIQRKVQMQVQKLRERLMATEKLLNSTTQAIDGLNSEMRVIQTSIDKEMAQIIELEKECTTLGSTIHGPSYSVPQQTIRSPVKRKLSFSSSHFLGKRLKSTSFTTVNQSKGTTLSSRIGQALSSQGSVNLQQLEEKKRLQLMERLLSLKLSDLRKKSMHPEVKAASPIRNTTATNMHSPSKRVPQTENTFVPPNAKRVSSAKFWISTSVLSAKKNSSLTSKVATNQAVLNSTSNTHDQSTKSTDEHKTGNVTNEAKVESETEMGEKKQVQDDHMPKLSDQQLEIVKALHTCKQRVVPELSADVESIVGCCGLKSVISLQHSEEKAPLIPFWSLNKPETKLQEEICVSVGVAYSSPLLHLHSYRLNPNFQSQGHSELSSTSYTHKVDARRQVCRFDLLGTCNDDKCTWQHSKAYKITLQDVLVDLLSYCPSVSGVQESDSLPVAQHKLEKYTSLLKESHQGSDEELCSSIVRIVNKHLGNAPPYFALSSRWKFNFLNQTKSMAKEEKLSERIKCRKGHSLMLSRGEFDPDAVVSASDQRYFHPENSKVEGLEEAVKENLHDIRLWLKLAYRQLNREDETDESNLDHALNVLSRALENNQTDPDLWQHYLTLYAKHPASDDLEVLCQQAVDFCPHYDVWWKYLQLMEGCEKKEKISGQVLEFLSAKAVDIDAETLSHYTLEITLFRVALSIQRGQHRKATEYLLKSIRHTERGNDCHYKMTGTSRSSSHKCNTTDDDETLPPGNETPSSKSCGCCPQSPLTVEDRCFGWLCYIHLMAFKVLPSGAFENGNGGLGHLVNKEPFLICWDQISNLSISASRSLLTDAMDDCANKNTKQELAKSIFPLFWNQVALELHQSRYEEALQLCTNQINLDPSEPKVWSLLSDIYLEPSLSQKVQEVFEDAICKFGYQPHICHAIASCAKRNGNTEEVLLVLEKCVKRFYNKEGQDTVEESTCNIDDLYCNLLNCENVEKISCNKKVLSDLPKPQLSKEDRLYMWLNYFLLLECKDVPASQITSWFETSLCQTTSAESLAVLWWQYLHFARSQVFHSCHEPDAHQSFVALVRRCLISVPSRKISHRHQSVSWVDFTFHNNVIDFFCGLLPSFAEKAAACVSFLGLLPQNIHLLKKAVKLFLDAGDKSSAMSVLKKYLNQSVTDTSLWKMALHFTYEEEDQQEIHRVFHHALEALPYSTTLWRDYLLYELSENHTSHVQQALGLSKNFQMSGLQDFIDSIL